MVCVVGQAKAATERGQLRRAGKTYFPKPPGARLWRADSVGRGARARKVAFTAGPWAWHPWQHHLTYWALLPGWLTCEKTLLLVRRGACKGQKAVPQESQGPAQRPSRPVREDGREARKGSTGGQELLPGKSRSARVHSAAARETGSEGHRQSVSPNSNPSARTHPEARATDRDPQTTPSL